MFRLRRSISKTFVPFVAFVALTNVGCSTTIAGKYPHLDRRSVCRLVPGIEADATEFVFTGNTIPVSNFHPEVVERVAAEARTVFLLDPGADPSSTRYLPAPYNELTCPERFSMLPSKDAETPPLPEASLELVVHEPRPEVVPRAVAEKLANCVSQSSGQLKPIEHAMVFNVYVTNEGRAVSAFVAQSTLGNRQTEACMVNVLRKTSWPGKVEAVAAAPTAAVSKVFLAQPAPVMPQPDSGPESGIRRIQPPLTEPRGVRIPRIFVIPLNPLAAAAVVFGILYFWSDNDAPAWASELNPITRQPYTSLQEYEEVRRLPAEEIKRQREQITNSQSQPPPAPAPPPAPDIKAQREQEKKAQQCAKIAAKIYEILYAERKATPNGGFPQGRKGIAERWREIAENKGKWGRNPNGELIDKAKNHLDEYDKGQRELNQELEKWEGCDPKDLPRLAREYATQTPEFGPGKPLEPKPNPPASAPVGPIGNVPKDKKRSE